jgi:hypothetical protein
MERDWHGNIEPTEISPLFFVGGIEGAGERKAVQLLEPAGKKLSQMIARWLAKEAGEGGREAFMAYANKLASNAIAEGTYVVGKVGEKEGARIFLQGGTYLVTDAEGKLLSYVPKADPTRGIVKVYEALGGK